MGEWGSKIGQKSVTYYLNGRLLQIKLKKNFPTILSWKIKIKTWSPTQQQQHQITVHILDLIRFKIYRSESRKML